VTAAVTANNCGNTFFGYADGRQPGSHHVAKAGLRLNVTASADWRLSTAQPKTAPDASPAICFVSEVAVIYHDGVKVSVMAYED
jgi:hypothetical protein